MALMAFTARPRNVRQALADNGLSLALGSLFLICAILHSISGWKTYNEALVAAGQSPIAYGSFLLTGTYQDAILNNWQAAVLQLVVLVIFSTFLRQKGAAHSRLSAEEKGKRKEPSKQPKPSNTFSWVYRNSLSIVLTASFVVFMALHVWTSNRAFNEEQLLRHANPEPLLKYLKSSNLMATTLENWQAEFFAIASYVMLTIFFRQDKSPESKKVEAENSDTGETNE